MSAVVGIDLSSKALDLVKLDEDSPRAEWVRVELVGRDAWERTLSVRELLLPFGPLTRVDHDSWWDDVYLVAIEAPYGRGQAGTQAVLNRGVGAVAASLPARLRTPERCWVVRPDEWKKGLGLKAKATPADMARLFPGWMIAGGVGDMFWPPDQNVRDAYCLAMFARDTNAKAVAA
jgi:hypothetical protein